MKNNFSEIFTFAILLLCTLLDWVRDIKHSSVLLDKVLLQGDQFKLFNCLNTVYKYCFEDCIKIVA